MLADILYAVVDPRVTLSTEHVARCLSHVTHDRAITRSGPSIAPSPASGTKPGSSFRRRRLSHARAGVRGASWRWSRSSRRRSPAPSRSSASTRARSIFPRSATSIALGEPDLSHRPLPRHLSRRILKQKDPESWAIWPLVYQDPQRRVREGEWPDQPANPRRTRPAEPVQLVRHQSGRRRRVRPDGPRHADRAVGRLRLDGHRRRDRHHRRRRWPATWAAGSTRVWPPPLSTISRAR